MKLKLIVFLFLVFPIQAQQVIILMGPSCAGKSTLSKELCIRLNNTHHNTWQVIDFDEVKENIELLIATTNNCLACNTNVIIDTNTYKKDMEKKLIGAATITKIIVTAPLEILLERDDKRTRNLNRDPQRAQRCHDFVIHSYNKSLIWPADFYIDSSQQSVTQGCDMILKFL